MSTINILNSQKRLTIQLKFNNSELTQQLNNQSTITKYKKIY